MGKRIQQVQLQSLGSETLYLGYVGENEHTQIVVNCAIIFTDYPDATASIVVRPPAGDLYHATITRNANRLIWEITSSDVIRAGSGQAQFTFENDGEVIRSIIARTRIDPSIEATGEAPEPLQNWMDQADAKAAEIAQDAARQAAVDVVEEAEAEIERVAGTIPADYTELSDDVDELKSAINELDDNFKSALEANDTIKRRKAVKLYAGGIDVSGEVVENRRAHTDFIENKEGEDLTVFFANTEKYLWKPSFYDENKEFVVSGPYKRDAALSVWNMNRNPYVRFDIYDPNAAVDVTLDLVSAETTIPNNLVYQEDFEPVAGSVEELDTKMGKVYGLHGTYGIVKTVIGKPLNITKDTTFLFVGDSITAKNSVQRGDPWVDYVMRDLGISASNYTNAAIPGADYGFDGAYIIDEITNALTEKNDYDFIYIAAGVNDYRGNVTLENFRSALDTVSTYLNTNYEGRVIIQTPIQSPENAVDNSSRIGNLIDYATVLFTWALENGYDVINGFDLGFAYEPQEYITEIYASDLLHPNDLGMAIYAKGVENALSNNVLTDDAERITALETTVDDVLDTMDGVLDDVADISNVKTQVDHLPDNLQSDAEEVDLDISDENGNVILRLANGHIKTKGFDSSVVDMTGAAESKDTGAENVDLDIADEDGNVSLRLADGHIQTKEFDSKEIKRNVSVLTEQVQKNANGLSASAYMPEGKTGALVQVECSLPLPVTSAVLNLPYKAEGYDSVNVLHCQKNLLDFANAEIKKNSSSSAYEKTEDSLTVTNSSVYTDLLTITEEFVNKHLAVSLDRTGDGAYRISVRPSDSTSGFVGYTSDIHIAKSWVGYTLSVQFFAGTNGTKFENIQVEITTSSTGTEFEAYNGTVYTSELPSGFYGGTVDLVSGTGISKYSSDGTEIAEQEITFAPSTISTFVGYNLFYSEHMKNLIYKVPVSERVMNLEQPNPLRVTIHDHSDFNHGFAYVAFSSGCILGGREVYVSRYGTGHMTPAAHSSYGKIGFVIRNRNGHFENVVFPDLEYETLNAELRDPNISNIDSNTAFLSGFATNNDESTPVYSNYLYVINKNLEMVDRLVFVSNKLFWGNTFITPSGYLLHCAYDTNHNLYLMKSDSVFSGSVSGITFTAEHSFGSVGNESTVARWNDKLVIVARTKADNVSTGILIYESDNLEGSGEFTEHHIVGYRMHSPAMNLTNIGDALLIAGGSVDGVIRRPFIIMVDKNFNELTSGTIDTDIDSYGAYPSFVRIDKEHYGMIYYSDSSEGGTDLYFQEVNINYFLNTAYHLF